MRTIDRWWGSTPACSPRMKARKWTDLRFVSDERLSDPFATYALE
jgi:hypothetical protein